MTSTTTTTNASASASTDLLSGFYDPCDPAHADSHAAVVAAMDSATNADMNPDTLFGNEMIADIHEYVQKTFRFVETSQLNEKGMMDGMIEDSVNAAVEQVRNTFERLWASGGVRAWAEEHVMTKVMEEIKLRREEDDAAAASAAITAAVVANTVYRPVYNTCGYFNWGEDDSDDEEEEDKTAPLARVTTTTAVAVKHEETAPVVVKMEETAPVVVKMEETAPVVVKMEETASVVVKMEETAHESSRHTTPVLAHLTPTIKEEEEVKEEATMVAAAFDGMDYDDASAPFVAVVKQELEPIRAGFNVKQEEDEEDEEDEEEDEKRGVVCLLTRSPVRPLGVVVVRSPVVRGPVRSLVRSPVGRPFVRSPVRSPVVRKPTTKPVDSVQVKSELGFSFSAVQVKSEPGFSFSSPPPSSSSGLCCLCAATD